MEVEMTIRQTILAKSSFVLIVEGQPIILVALRVFPDAISAKAKTKKRNHFPALATRETTCLFRLKL